MISSSDNSATDMLLHTARPRQCRADDGDGRRRRARRATGRCSRRSSCRRSRPRRRRRSTSGCRPTRPAGGACSRRPMPRPTPAGSTSAASPATRSHIDASNGSPRRPTWCGRWTGCGATATTRRAAILAINPGLAPAQRGGFAYVGYKGGSEPGVLNLTWLVRNRAGHGTSSPAPGTIRPRRSTRQRFIAPDGAGGPAAA